jgi:hypothetical protein
VSTPGQAVGSQDDALIRPKSLYADLLEAVLDERERSGAAPSNGEALADLVQRRHQVLLNRQSRPDEGGATTALTDEVAYDAALIRQARRLGIDCDPSLFGGAQHERHRLEQALRSRGLPLN